LDFVFVAIRELFARFGTPIVFFAALAESTVGLGFVFPGQVIMALGGAAAARGEGGIAAILAVAILGTIIGDTASYALGRWGSRFLRQTRLRRTLDIAEALMTGKALWMLPLYHLHSVTRSLGPFGAGALRLPLRAWIPLDYAGAALFNVIWVGLGYVLGQVVLTEDGRLKDHPSVRIGFIVLGVVSALVAQHLYERKRAEIEAAEARAGAQDAETVSAG
jgi:membrane protein DedA with SNARE-associated domain